MQVIFINCDGGGFAAPVASGWHAALAHVAAQEVSMLRELSYALRQAELSARPPSRFAAVTAAGLLRDLDALDAELGVLAIDDALTGVSVVTGPVTLEDVPLGRFRTELDARRLLAGRFDPSAFSAVALGPNPAASNESVTHPHVQDGCVGLGDGEPAVRAALLEGRL